MSEARFGVYRDHTAQIALWRSYILLAKTQGHGNPDWTRDETILALALYLDLDGKIPSAGDKRVQELSRLLRSLPFHENASRKSTFRNPSGVAFKLQNLRQVATGKGFENVSVTDRQVWEELGDRPQRVKELATLISEAIAVSAMFGPLEEEEFEFAEGRLITILHRRRERSPKLRVNLLRSRKRRGQISCDMCGVYPVATHPDILEAQFEVHHVIPLSAEASPITRLSDTALLCASCHRLLHKAIAVEKRWLDIAQAKQICGLK